MVDFARDVDEVTDTLRQGGSKVGKYTGHIKVDDRKLADRKFLARDIKVLIITESFELGVDNPNIISQVIRIGCPEILGCSFKKWAVQVGKLSLWLMVCYLLMSILMIMARIMAEFIA